MYTNKKKAMREIIFQLNYITYTDQKVKNISN